MKAIKKAIKFFLDSIDWKDHPRDSSGIDDLRNVIFVLFWWIVFCTGILGCSYILSIVAY